MALEKWLSNVAKTGDYNDLENKPEVNSDLNVSSDTIMASAKSVKIVNDKVEEIKNNVDGGKDNIANAITSKGIEASKDETFESLSEKIKNIKTGVDTTDANAVSGDIISGKTAYVNDIKVTGSLVNQPSIVDAISVGQDGTNKFFRIPQGAYVNNASENYPEIKCNATSIDENIKPENIIKGKTICGVEGTGVTKIYDNYFFYSSPVITLPENRYNLTEIDIPFEPTLIMGDSRSESNTIITEEKFGEGIFYIENRHDKHSFKISESKEGRTHIKEIVYSDGKLKITSSGSYGGSNYSYVFAVLCYM